MKGSPRPDVRSALKSHCRPASGSQAFVFSNTGFSKSLRGRPLRVIFLIEAYARCALVTVDLRQPNRARAGRLGILLQAAWVHQQTGGEPIL